MDGAHRIVRSAHVCAPQCSHTTLHRRGSHACSDADDAQRCDRAQTPAEGRRTQRCNCRTCTHARVASQTAAEGRCARAADCEGRYNGRIATAVTRAAVSATGRIRAAVAALAGGWRMTRAVIFETAGRVRAAVTRGPSRRRSRRGRSSRGRGTSRCARERTAECHICAGTGLTRTHIGSRKGRSLPASLRGQGSLLPIPRPWALRGHGYSKRPHLRRDWAYPAHICAGTGPTPSTSATGLTGLNPPRVQHGRKLWGECSERVLPRLQYLLWCAPSTHVGRAGGRSGSCSAHTHTCSRPRARG